MLKVDLGRLGREGSVVLETQVSAEDDFWKDSGIKWAGPVDFRLRTLFAGTGEVVVRGSVQGPLQEECRRCTRPVDNTLEEEVTLVYVSADTEAESEEAGAYLFEPIAGELDLSNAVREEIILAINPYVVCDPKCSGLCPRCGVDLNQTVCDCGEVESDPRWEALRALKDR